MKTPPLMIAELGSNPAPNWNFVLWCKAAKDAGADAVKVQLFRAESFPQEEQESKRAVEFPRDRIADFARTAHDFGLECGASVFDTEAVELAAMHLDFLKLAAREQENRELLNIVVVRAYDNKPTYRSINTFSADTTSLTRITTLFTISEYPAPSPRSLVAVIRAANYFSKFNNRKWGWSSHSKSGIECVLASRLGTCVIERHLAISKNNIESGHSSTPNDFAKLAKRIKQK